MPFKPFFPPKIFLISSLVSLLSVFLLFNKTAYVFVAIMSYLQLDLYFYPILPDLSDKKTASILIAMTKHLL